MVLTATTAAVPEMILRARMAAWPPHGPALSVVDLMLGLNARWGQVTSWADDGVVIVHDIGPELAPMTRAADAVPIQARRIVDWAIWQEGKGVVEGATTEGVSGP